MTQQRSPLKLESEAQSFRGAQPRHGPVGTSIARRSTGLIPPTTHIRAEPRIPCRGPDLLAPILLNVRHISLQTYDSLIEALPDLNANLALISRDAALETASARDLGRVSDLFGVLDDLALPGVQLTTLSKILHRKRPRMIPLYDEHIRRCYQELGDPPVPGEKGRSWGGFADLWLPAVQNDLATQLSSWQEIAALAPGPAITPLRALDIVGWFRGRPVTSG